MATEARSPGAPAPVPASDESRPAGARGRIEYKWLVGIVVLVGAVMVILDQTVVVVALPTLQRDFGVSLTDIQWIVTAYTLALAAVIPMSGWLSDRYGARRVLFTSQFLFTCGSMLCGLAWSNTALLGFRVLQGLGGGLIMPVGMAMLMRVTRPDERGRLMALMGFPMLVAPVLGPTLGGWLVQAVSWRLIFYINLPVGIAGCLLTAFLLREAGRQERSGGRLDVGGMILATPAVVGIVYGLSQPGTHGWGSAQTLLPLLGGLALIVAFCFYELRRANPLIDIRVFHDAAFSASMALNFLGGLALFGAIFLMPLFLQQVQGRSPLDAGVILGAQGIAAAMAMPIAGVLTDRLGAARVVPFGLTALTAGSIWLTTIAANTPAWETALMLGVRGLGMGFMMMPSMSAAYVTLHPSQMARATSVANVIQRVAGGLGVAVLATILSNRITANLPPLPRGVSAASGAGIGGAHLPEPLKSLLLAQVAKGFGDTFWVSVGLVLLCFPMAVLLRRAMRPEEVRSYAIGQLTEGLVLGAAARRLRDGRVDGLPGRFDAGGAYQVLAASATSRLRKGTLLLEAGTNASGLVPQRGISAARRALFGILLVAALVGMVVAIARGYQAPAVPALGPAVTAAQTAPLEVRT